MYPWSIEVLVCDMYWTWIWHSEWSMGAWQWCYYRVLHNDVIMVLCNWRDYHKLHASECFRFNEICFYELMFFFPFQVYAYYKTLPMPITSYKFGSTDPITGQEIVDDNSQFVSSVCWRSKSNTVVAANSSGGIKLLQMVWSREFARVTWPKRRAFWKAEWILRLVFLPLLSNTGGFASSDDGLWEFWQIFILTKGPNTPPRIEKKVCRYFPDCNLNTDPLVSIINWPIWASNLAIGG